LVWFAMSQLRQTRAADRSAVTTLSVADLARAYRSGDLDPVTVTQAYLSAIATDPVGRLAYRVVMEERALRQAGDAQRLLDDGIDLGPLMGVPIAIKDLLDTEGEVSASGSKVMLGRPAAAEDAPVAARLDAAGAVFLGRTNMTELAFSGIGINPHFGTPPCALDDDRVPGGSSSGSGVAVARGLAAAAVGSDTGGSVRIPASINGIVGLKTTDGLLPTDGAVPLSTTLDTLGPMARDCDDAWSLFCAMAALPATALDADVGRLTLLAPTTLLSEGLEPDVKTAFEAVLGALAGLGHEVQVRPLELLAEAPALYRTYGSFAGHEAWAIYERELTERPHEMDPRVTHRMTEYANSPSSNYIRLHQGMRDLRRRFWPGLAGVDAIVAPTLPILPPRIADLESDEAYFVANSQVLRNTAPFNVLGCPAASVPCAITAKGLSVGLMIVTRPGEDELALRIAKHVELVPAQSSTNR
jgi:aspartyl-tRNA(Asn)/glutamyl-tRNA(Gln) amidotransferase subunit A